MLFRSRFILTQFIDLQDQIDKLERTALVGGERQDAIDYCLASISRLTTEVHDALDFIPAYDQRAYTAVGPTSILKSLHLSNPLAVNQ